ncbi:MAG: zinc ribbon domain-containing protein [Kiritimatiellae bacterium]|nr:zinc ribbon domain-containing protein [Kiritimatiellia bacterium]
MPIYEYECKKCGAVFELIRSFGASDVDVKCAQCGSPRILRLISAPSRVSKSCGPTSRGT